MNVEIKTPYLLENESGEILTPTPDGLFRDKGYNLYKVRLSRDGGYFQYCPIHSDFQDGYGRADIKDSAMLLTIPYGGNFIVRRCVNNYGLYSPEGELLRESDYEEFAQQVKMSDLTQTGYERIIWNGEDDQGVDQEFFYDDNSAAFYSAVSDLLCDEVVIPCPREIITGGELETFLPEWEEECKVWGNGGTQSVNWRDYTCSGSIFQPDIYKPRHKVYHSDLLHTEDQVTFFVKLWQWSKGEE